MTMTVFHRDSLLDEDQLSQFLGFQSAAAMRSQIGTPGAQAVHEDKAYWGFGYAEELRRKLRDYYANNGRMN